MVEKLMELLDLTEEQAKQLIEDDKAIDKGADLFPLDPELEKGAKKARQADRKPTTATRREKKEDLEKQAILTALLNAILPTAENYTVANAEREFSFVRNGKKYKVVLSCPRS